jgi:phosphoglycolate phosphatase-like HAD superfamily hydrolase
VHPLLLLWDIDGTLISTGRAGVEALQQALLNDFGIIDDLGDIEIAGRTDTAITADICRKHQQHLFTGSDLLEAYLEHLPLVLPKKNGQIFPGIKDILNWSHDHTEVHNALLTGNVKKGAYIKLGHYQLAEYFEFGAFGDDSIDRNKLGPIALERARSFLKKDFHIEYTWIIGDTPRDIDCARALGCKVLAVATGRYSVEQLQQHEPDLVLPSLSDHKSVITELERR